MGTDQSNGDARPGPPMRFAYADPPYPGQARRHYGDHPDYGGEVDYPKLIERLELEYPDGWALSCASLDLRDLLPLCPAPEWRRGPHTKWPRRKSHTGSRVLIWVKTFTPMKPKVGVQYGWEPIILRGGRRRTLHDGLLVDWIACSPINPRAPGAVTGMKPDPVCFWLFRALGARPGDELDDLFPGSGAVSRAWARFMAQRPLHFGGPIENEEIEGFAAA